MISAPKYPVLIYLGIITLLTFIAPAVTAGEKICPPDIVKPLLRIYEGPLISYSDTIMIGNRLLRRDVDYKINYLNGSVTLYDTVLPVDDTLLIKYTPLPLWLKSRYGIDAGRSVSAKKLQRETSGYYPGKQTLPAGSDITIKGAKRFSVTSQTSGDSRFTQSLEMSISGMLAENLEIYGSVADHGFDPAYGTINSRISELDKLKVIVRSPSFLAEIGNLEIESRSDFPHPLRKQMSGLNLKYATSTMSAKATFARPKGYFETVRFNGMNQNQGPYRLASGNQIVAVVPGSETVWVNGNRVERGSDKDYIIDNPAAAITFTPRLFVDSRTRIEVDFEPLSLDYQRELLGAGGGLSSPDSVIYFRIDMIREGDAKDRLKFGELSPEDISFLQNLGDSTSGNLTGGETANPEGAYVERFDMEGNRYFEYVGQGAGDYNVSFLSVGSGQGEYTYEGGDIYRFVGAGQGEYIAARRIPVPAMENLFEAELGTRFSNSGMIDFTIRQSNYDRNLYSSLDDHNNAGGQYIMKVQFGKNNSSNMGKPILDLKFDFINKNYKPYSRRNSPDIERRFLMPVNLTPDNHQSMLDLSTAAMIMGPYGFDLSSAYLGYRDQFRSATGEIVLSPKRQNSFWPRISYGHIDAKFDESGNRYKGEGDKFGFTLRHTWNSNFDLESGVGFDRRKNKYSGFKKGTTEKEFYFQTRYRFITAEYRRYDEDTLIVSWQNFLLRQRAMVRLSGRIWEIKSDLYLTGQKSDYTTGEENQFMARFRYSYSPDRANLSITGHYALSDENRYQRGVRYLEVNPGEGKFIFEDGQYIPESEGNFIEVEEILSSQAPVSKGEKSLNLTFRPQNLYFKFVSSINEDMLDVGERNLLWILPFYSNGDEAYLYRKTYHSSEIGLFRYPGYYFITLAGSQNNESRRIGSENFEKYERLYRLSFHEANDKWHFIQEGSYFEYQRDSYYSSPGNIEGYKINLNQIYDLGVGQINSSIGFRTARDDNDSKSNQYLVVINPVIRLFTRGESSLRMEFYRQELSAVSSYSYRLTDNLTGKRGVRWVIRSDYDIGKDLKISILFNGRHSNDRKPRIIGKGELIATF
jgi:hypothetical protein